MDRGRQPSAPRVRLEPGFEERWPGSSRLATGCFVNFWVLRGLIEAYSQSWTQREGYASSAAFNVLTVLHGAQEPLLPSVIAERLLVTRPTITGILDSLEREGYIRRTSHPNDGRKTLIEIAPAARRKIESSRRKLHVIERQVMEALSRAEQREFLRMIGQLQASVTKAGSNF
ncbi:MAG: MarR family winged helix-turn-helix transcriptional regulator [Actinomycetota bacterium]